MERVVIPTRIGKTEVGIPSDTDPVKFKALDLELSGRVFQVKAGARVGRFVEEPVNGIDFDADIDRVWFESLRFRGCDKTKAFGTASVLVNPLFSQIKIARNCDGEAGTDFSENFAGSRAFAI